MGTANYFKKHRAGPLNLEEIRAGIGATAAEAERVAHLIDQLEVTIPLRRTIQLITPRAGKRRRAR